MTVWRSFLCAWGLDRCADMMWTTILAWLASDTSHPAAQGLILAAATVPHLAVLLLGGALADKYGSSTVAKLTTLAKASLLLVLLASQAGPASLVLLAGVAAIVGAVDGLHDPSMESWGMRLRPPEEQEEAAAAEATVWRIAQLIGAALAGWLLGLGAVLAVAVTVALYLAQRVFLSLMDRGVDVEQPAKDDASEAGQPLIRDGLGFIRRRPVFWNTMGVQTVCTLTSGAVMMLLLPRLIRDNDWPAVTYGAAATCFGGGMALGASLIMRFRKRQQESAGQSATRDGIPLMGFGFAAVCHLPLLVLGLATGTVGPVGVVATMLVFGVLLGPVGPILTGYRRARTPEQSRGVVTAAARLITLGPEPLGPLAAGVITGFAGTRSTLVACAVAGIVAAACGAAGAKSADRASTPS